VREREIFVNPESLKRTVVVGTSCSGKTTFARRLAGLLSVKRIELDAINWLPGWRPRPHEEFRMLVEEAVSADEWVLDGNYSRTRDIVLPRATALIWLNYSFPLVGYRALSRTTRRVFYKQTSYAGNKETFRRAFLSRDSILVWVLKTFHRRRREYSELLQELRRDERMRIIVFRTPSEAERFLSQLEKETKARHE
jgi:adenylate kinase family enzyme